MKVKAEKDYTWADVIKVSDKNCKLEKVNDFLSGIFYGELVGLGVITAEFLTKTSLNLPIGSEILVGGMAGAVLGYAKYRKNKAKYENKNRKWVNYAEEQIAKSLNKDEENVRKL